ncbi:MAG: MFS transporter [Thermoleophilia bacterium]|nr:MFS transporter [Thermoleophilia bacterium]
MSPERSGAGAVAAGGLRGHAAEAAATVAAVAANRPLARVQLAWAASNVGNWAYFVAVAVYAYAQGGAAAVGVLGFLRLLAPALTAPLLASLADRFRRTRVMVVSDVVVAVALAAAALSILTGLPAVVVYALVVALEVAHSPFRPAQAALLPSLAREPHELAAANLAASTIESVGSFLGPALAGLALLLAGPEVTIAATAALFLGSALVVRGVPEGARAERAAGHARLRHELVAGGRAIARDRRTRLLVALYAAQTVVGGIIAVLLVVLSFEQLDLGESGVGLLNAVIGAGGVVGALATLVLLRRLAATFTAGLLLWGVPLALLALSPTLAVAAAMFVLVGIGNTLVDVAGITLMQRAVREDVLARAFGVLESILLASLGFGLLVAPLLDSLLGTRGALAASGLPLAVLAVVFSRSVAAFESAAPSRARELALLRAVPPFAPLPPAALETLAARLGRETYRAGAAIVRQGEAGDRFYVVAEGELDVHVDGRPAPRLKTGDSFGEIALLRDVPRTATVVAATDVELYALARDDFLAAVAGYAESAEAASAVVAARLASLRPLGVSR